MYAQFGQKWAKLHHGPLWSYALSDQSVATGGQEYAGICFHSFFCICGFKFVLIIFVGKSERSRSE